ncbi:hypothetical protein LTR27_004518 [Elasticomyces elasticus]|nr:hypothetical protein LTR27_004518 [Elasticomyces elasticus]
MSTYLSLFPNLVLHGSSHAKNIYHCFPGPALVAYYNGLLPTSITSRRDPDYCCSAFGSVTPQALSNCFSGGIGRLRYLAPTHLKETGPITDFLNTTSIAGKINMKDKTVSKGEIDSVMEVADAEERDLRRSSQRSISATLQPTMAGLYVPLCNAQKQC